MILKDFKLINETKDAYEIAHPNGRKFMFKKSGMKEKAHKLVKGLKLENNFQIGGKVEGSDISADPAITEAPTKFLIPGYNEPVMSPNSPLIDPMSGVNAAAPANPNPEMTAPPVATGAITPAEGKLGIMDQAFEAQKKAEDEKMRAQQIQMGMESNALKAAQAKIDQMQTQQQIVADYKKRDDELLKGFMDKKIDPNRYYKNMNTGSKLAAGIGMILGGLGAGATGGRNQAVDMIQAAINNDIEAQKSDKERSLSLWKMNREALGNDLAADLATKNQLYTGLKYNLMQAQAAAGSQMAKANADAAIGLINKEQAVNNQQLYFLKQGMGLTGQGGEGFVGKDPSVLVENNIKDPSLKAAAYKEIERAQIVAKQTPAIMKKFDDAAKSTRPFTGGAGAIKNAVPGYTSPDVKALHAELGPTFQHLEGTVRQAAMDNMNNNIVPQFGDSDETIKTKREALQHYLSDSTAYPVTKGHNIDVSKFSSTAPARISANPMVQTFMRNNPQITSEEQAVKILKAHGKM